MNDTGFVYSDSDVEQVEIFAEDIGLCVDFPDDCHNTNFAPHLIKEKPILHSDVTKEAVEQDILNSPDCSTGRQSNGSSGSKGTTVDPVSPADFCCNLCSYKTKRRGCLIRHKSTCNSKMNPEHKCPVCRDKFQSRSKLDNHILKSHHKQTKALIKGKIYSCPHCSYKTVYSRYLKQHLSCHSGKPFICNFCSVRFRYRESLEKHLAEKRCRIYMTGRKVCYCKYCSYSSPSRMLAYKHLMVHELGQGIPPFYCYNCDYETPDKTSLISHMQVHNTTKKNKLVCNICKESFEEEADLKGHLQKAHVKKYKGFYKCTKCSYKSLKSAPFNRHVLHAHLYRMSFGCEHCDVKFKNQSLLNFHMFRCHYEEFNKIKDDINCTVYSCKYCKYETVALNRFKIHQLDKHPDMPTNVN